VLDPLWQFANTPSRYGGMTILSKMQWDGSLDVVADLVKGASPYRQYRQHDWSEQLLLLEDKDLFVKHPELFDIALWIKAMKESPMNTTGNATYYPFNYGDQQALNVVGRDKDAVWDRRGETIKKVFADVSDTIGVF